MDEVQHTIAALTPAELDRVCVPPDAPGHPNHEHTVLACLHVILNEEWEHHRYAVARSRGARRPLTVTDLRRACRRVELFAEDARKGHVRPRKLSDAWFCNGVSRGHAVTRIGSGGVR